MTSNHITVNLGTITDTSLTYDPKDNTFLLGLEDSKGGQVTVTLTPETLQTLALKCIARLPELNAPLRVATDTEAIRQPARMLLRYDDRSIQLILREIQSDTLQAFLWFMKDAELLKRILANMSRRAAEYLMDDLQQNWAGKDPDDNSRTWEIKGGGEAVATLLATCRRLTDEGQLPEVTARPEALPGEGDLTEAKVDTLLTALQTNENQEGAQ